MGVVTALAVGAGVAAVGSAASGIAQKRAADKAAATQKGAIEDQKQILRKRLDPEVLNDLARKADEARAKSRLALQKEIDPELAALRQRGKEQLLEDANVPNESRQSNRLASALFQETQQQDPRVEALKDALITRAQSELDAGATLPSEFQAELVRAGISQGAQSGVGTGRDQVGGPTARLLGVAGIQLQQQRQNEAIKLGEAAQSLKNARVNILSTVFPKLKDLETVQRNEAAQNFGLGDAALPESGLSGQDVTNIEIARSKGISDLIGKRGQVSAQQQQAKGAFQGALIGAAASGISGAAGAFGGGGTANLLSAGVGGPQVDVGTFGGRTPAQNRNFNFLSSYYQ